MPLGGPVPVSQKLNEEVVHWRSISHPWCTSQPSLTLSLTLPFHTFHVIKGKEKRQIICLYISVVVVLPCIQQYEGCRGHQTCGRCDHKDWNHMEEDFPNETRYPNCQKLEALIDQFRKTHINTKVNNERPGSAFKLSPSKLDRDPSTARIKSPKRINKQYNAERPNP